ncbi:MAG: RIP metalloprotease RseP [Prevotella sp.]|nr:RIP metalloprotease RseP [Bacteroides sp.]MCM1366346.1 RIP metalloprotease RseP [Prevotella sp.]MCM1436296.1 RIP metalloprotease RseP [Prevotella sp.]
MDTFLIKAAQLIIALGLLIILHEFGHFLFARIFGVKVEKFYIFFDPWTELFKWKPKKYIGGLGKTKRLSQCEKAEGKEEVEKGKEEEKKGFWSDTEYGVGWIPLGGYCKIAGMIDESMDTEQMKLPPKKWEFRSKPAWQRLLIMIAGVLFNFLTAILIYAGIVYATGEKYVPVSEAKNGMIFSGEARKAGFHNGDIPLRADGETLDEPGEARVKMLQAKEVTVLRDGKEVVVPIDENLIFRLDKEAKSDTAMISFMTYNIPTRITQVVPGEGASKAGIKVGDEVIAVAGTQTPGLDRFLETLAGHENETVPVTLVRKSESKMDTLTVQVPLSNTSKMGVGLEVDPSAFYKTKEIRYNLLQSVPRGVEMGTDKLVSYAKSMKLVFTKEGAQSVGGFGSIGAIFPEKWDWIAFWNITAFLSVALAFMNIIPIPALDGGHVLFLLIEVITGRKPSEKVMEWAQMIGMGLLILLLVYANGMDIIRLFK